MNIAALAIHFCFYLFAFYIVFRLSKRRGSDIATVLIAGGWYINDEIIKGGLENELKFWKARHISKRVTFTMCDAQSLYT